MHYCANAGATLLVLLMFSPTPSTDVCIRPNKKPVNRLVPSEVPTSSNPGNIWAAQNSGLNL